LFENFFPTFCRWCSHYLLQWWWFPICVFIWVAEWQLLYIVELISTGDGQIIETLDNIGIKLHWKNITCIICYSFVCLCCVVPVSMHYRLYLVTVCMKVLQNGRLLRFSKRTDCWCMFSWSICNQNGHFIRCIQSSIFQGYDDIHKSWEDIIS